MIDLLQISSLIKESSGKVIRAIKRNRVALVCSMILPLVLCNSIWNYQGLKTDEGELVYFAIGFMGGDFDPHWYGYGSLGMYLLYAVYMILYIPQLLMGKFANLEEYAMSMFDSGYFVIVARYTYTMIGVLTVFVYAKTLKVLNIHMVFIAVFVLLSLLSIDLAAYSDYLRNDLLISFFVSLLVYLSCAEQKLSITKKIIYISIIIAASLATKISILPLIGLVFLIPLLEFINPDVSRKQLVYASLYGLVIIIIGFLVLQPYGDHMEIIFGRLKKDGIASIGIQQSTTLSSRLDILNTHIFRYLKTPFVILLGIFPIVMVLFKKYRQLIILLFIILSLVAVSLISKRPRDYWLLPLFPVVRFCGILAIGYLATLIHQKFRFHKNTIAVVLGLSIFLFAIGPYWKSYIGISHGSMNSISVNYQAKKWIEANILGKHNLLLDEHSWTLPPLMVNDLNLAKRMSGIFGFNKRQNVFLNRIFEQYHKQYHASFDSNNETKVELAKLYIFQKTKLIEPDPCHNYSGYYFLIDDIIIQRYFERDSSGLDEVLIKKQELVRKGYECYISNPLVKSWPRSANRNLSLYLID